eukprot:TRINITY_DN2595_c3_g1_i1.p1 TRINITY_DN2595_c3_g1~~TRINITY_DN2595_c3_g1_i1.p1  ORF type:complete len:458 (-),score=97.89 TRINITY_DN2595_c3_g1_i1:22-1395(-)
MEPSINNDTGAPVTFGSWYRNQTPHRQRILKTIVLVVLIFFITVIVTLLLTLTPSRFNNDDKDPLPRLQIVAFRGSEDLEFLEYYNGTLIKNQTTGYFGSLWDPFACVFTGQNDDKKDGSTDFYCYYFDRMRSIQKLIRINNGRLMSELVIPVAGNGYVESVVWDPKREEMITVDQAWFVRMIIYDRQGNQLRKMMLQMDSWWRLAKVAIDIERNILYYSPWYYRSRGGFKSIRGTNYVTGTVDIEAEVPLPKDGSILDFVVKHSEDTEYDHLIVLATENINNWIQWSLVLIDFDPITNKSTIIHHFPKEIGISPELWVHTHYDESRHSFFAVMWNNTKTETSKTGEAVLVWANTELDFVTYVPLPGIILPEEGDPYYYYYDSSYDDSYDDSSDYDYDWEASDGGKEASGSSTEGKEDTGKKRRTIRSMNDLMSLRKDTSIAYWPDYYYSVEAITIL